MIAPRFIGDCNKGDEIIFICQFKILNGVFMSYNNTTIVRKPNLTPTTKLKKLYIYIKTYDQK